MIITVSKLVEMTGLSVNTVRNFLSVMEKYRIIGNERPLLYDIPDFELYNFYIRVYTNVPHLSKYKRQRLHQLIQQFKGVEEKK